MEIFTDRSKGFIQEAQGLAIRNSNQFITPEHLFKVLIEDKKGLCYSLIYQTGINTDEILKEVFLNVYNYINELKLMKNLSIYLENAVSTVEYKNRGVKYTREYIASYPDKVIAARYKAEGGKLTRMTEDRAIALADLALLK